MEVPAMIVPFYGHVRQYHNIKTEIDANIHEVLESGQYVMGPVLARFEKELAAYHGLKHAIGVGNGTDALWLAFMALGIGPGDECITTTNTFFATAEAIWIAGATVVFVDSDPRTSCIDPSKIEAAITPKTKALVPVHLYGQCADMKALRQIADKHKLFVVEDNAQALGAAGDSRSAGLAMPSAPASSSRRTWEPLGMAARWLPTTSTWTARSAECATTDRRSAPVIVTASIAALTTSTPVF
jgi:UDP-2-acetamido-2-deoxy-ribo-hexuluronate aminotransferase